MKYMVLIFLVILLPLASAAKISLLINQSYTKDGRNITLLDINKDKILVCVNNEKGIVSKDKLETVNDVSIDIKNIYTDRIRAELKVYCTDCKCNSDCNNTLCSNYDHKIQEEIKKEVTVKAIKSDTELIQVNTSLNKSLLIALGIIIVLIIILYFLIKVN